MMQQRWTKWKDDNGTYIVPYYFSKSFPGTEENIHTINSHIDWFNKAGFQILALWLAGALDQLIWLDDEVSESESIWKPI